MEIRATLSKSERLKSKKEIDKLFKSGQSLFVFPFKLFYRFNEGEAPLKIRMGVTVPKSMHKKAVDRNRLKRKIREAYRTSKVRLLRNNHHLHKSVDLFFVYICKDEKENLIQHKMALLLCKLENELKNQNS